MPKLEELAYIAGIIDGEGCIGVYPNGKNHSLHVMVMMCDPEAIGEIYEHFGGTFSGYQGENAYVYRIIMTGDRAYQFLKTIRRFLRVKAEQADWGMEFHEECRTGKGFKLTPEIAEKQLEYAAVLKELKVLPFSWEQANS